ncbi:MAG: acyl carrier protein [Pseudomonadota bacterium]|jgi:acyl carrier protein
MNNLDRVRAVIADALYVDLEQVEPGANLMADLGAESIDFLDIMFRLEKEFNIKLPRGEIEQKARGQLSEAEFAVDGRLTDAGLANLRAMLPEVKETAFRPGLHLREIPTLFTVQTFVRMVGEQLTTGDAALAGAGTERPASL